MAISVPEAAKTLYDRKAAAAGVRRSLAAWAEYRGYKPAKHHRFIINELEPFIRGETDDEIILLHAPPGSAKSTYFSVLAPEAYLARHPQNLILAATHSGDFVNRWGKRVRNDVVMHSRALGLDLRPGAGAADNWGLVQGGEYYGASPSGGVSGVRCDFGIFDDLFGNRADAMSPTVRASRWEWYLSDFSGRLRPGAFRAGMNTRWHLADVAGHIIDQIEAGVIKGKVINLRARAEADDPLGRRIGQYLWDDDDYGYPKFLQQRERELDPQTWEALYQQRPVAETGDYFRAAWLRTYKADSLPPKKEMVYYGGSDFAVTNNGGDYTVHIIVGLDADGRMYVVDLWRGQTDSNTWIDHMCTMIKKWGPLGWAVEKGQINSSVGPFMRRRMQERQSFVAIMEFPTRGDKAIRAQSIRGRIANRGLYLPEYQPWYKPLVVELLTFDKGVTDDQVDSLGLVGQLLDKMIPGQRPYDEPQRNPRDAYKPLEDERVDSMITG